MDDADRAGPRIEQVVADGIQKARIEWNKRLLPVTTQDEDGRLYGICHYCESSIKAGNLYCENDREQPEFSCSVMDERERKMRKDNGQ